MARLTVRDLLDARGKHQFAMLRVETLDEAEDGSISLVDGDGSAQHFARQQLPGYDASSCAPGVASGGDDCAVRSACRSRSMGQSGR